EYLVLHTASSGFSAGATYGTQLESSRQCLTVETRARLRWPPRRGIASDPLMHIRHRPQAYGDGGMIAAWIAFVGNYSDHLVRRLNFWQLPLFDFQITWVVRMSMDQVVRQRQRLNAVHQAFHILRMMFRVETEHVAIFHYQPEHLRPAAIHPEIHYRHAARHRGTGRLNVLSRRCGIRWRNMPLNRLLGIDPERLRATDRDRRRRCDHRQCNHRRHLYKATHCHDLSCIPRKFWRAQHPRNRRSSAVRIDRQTATHPGCCSTPLYSECTGSCSDAVAG